MFLILLLLAVCNAGAQSPEILVSVTNNSLVYYHLETQESKEVPLSSGAVNQVNCRSLAYDPDRCVFYAIIDFRQTPKLYEISIYGVLNYIGQLTLEDERDMYSCEAIAYNPEDKTLYGSISVGTNNYYTDEFVKVDVQTAECTLVTTINTLTPKGADADALSCYNGDLVIMDGDPTPYTYFFLLDMDNPGQESYPVEVYNSNQLIGVGDIAVCNHYLYGVLNGKLIKADLRSSPLNFTEDRSYAHIAQNVPGFTSFDKEEIFSKILPDDTLLCMGDSLFLSIDPAHTMYWSDGDSNSRLLSEEGSYFGLYKSGSCLFRTDTFDLRYKICDSCEIKFDNIKEYLDLGRDTVLCTGDTFYLNISLSADSVHWSDGSRANRLKINGSGQYWAGVYIDSCVFFTDTISITEKSCKTCMVYIPNAFTPNNDLINDVFRPVVGESCAIDKYHLRIYNFWGEKLLDSSEPVWDGTYIGVKVQPGVYIYMLIYELESGQSIERYGVVYLER